MASNIWRALPAAALADERHGLAGRHHQVEPPEDRRLPLRVRELHAPELDAAGECVVRDDAAEAGRRGFHRGRRDLADLQARLDGARV